MSINVDALRKRLGEISNKNKRSNLLWKPSNGKQIIRIVPYAKDPENPFIELKFHYDLGGRTYLSPTTYGNPDPVVEFANKVKGTGDQSDYELAKKFFPKLRVYVPIIVRGQEEEGVRFWGFGKQVYQSLLGIVADEDYGDITSLKNGNDITVVYKPKEETGKNFPETDILPRPKKTTVDAGSNIDADKLLEYIKNQPDLSEIFQEPSYDELKDVLEKYLHPEEDESEEPSSLIDDVVETSGEESSEVEKEKAPKTAGKEDWDNLFGE